MSFFSGSSSTKLNPRTKESKAGGQWMLGQLNQYAPGTSPDFPTQQVADLTPIQKLIQSQLGSYMNASNAGYDAASKYYTDTLSGGYDPRTSPYYNGLKAEAADLNNANLASIRQNANMGGMLKSSGRSGVEARTTREANNQLNTQLGGLYENERTRMAQAAEGIQNLNANRVANANNISQLADAQRQIEQQKMNAIYTQAMQMLMFPYEQQSKLAATMMNYSPGTYQTSSPSGLATVLGYANSAANIFKGMSTSGMSDGLGTAAGRAGNFLGDVFTGNY